MPGHTHNCLTLPPGECSGALRSCLALLGNAVTPLSLFSLSHSHFFPPLHSHFFASHSHFPFSCSVGFFSLCCFSLFLLGAMMVSSPRSSWGMLSPHSHFFPFTLSLFCFTPSLFILLVFLPSSQGISFQYILTPIFFSSCSIYTQSLNWVPLKLGHIEEPLRFKNRSYFTTFFVKLYNLKEILYLYL